MTTPYPAKFHDGRTAAQREVTVSLDVNSLRFRDQAGKEITRWPYAELCLVDEMFAARPLRLRRIVDDGARLTLPDDRLFAELVSRAPQLGQRRAGPSGLRIAMMGIAGTAIFAAIVWFALPRLVDLAASVIPVSWEEALGQQVFDDITEALASLGEEGTRLCEGAAGQAALDRLSERLAVKAEAPYRFRVFVIDLKMPNAFALPGGWIVLFRGLIASAEGPGEVAGVLAHEMGHVVHRHSTRNILRALGLQALFDLMMGDMGDGLGGSLGQALLYFSYSREAEAEADAAALTLLARAGMGAAGLARFFERLVETQGGTTGVLQLFSTHPSHEARARLFAGATSTGDPAMSAADWAALKGICGSN